MRQNFPLDDKSDGGQTIWWTALTAVFSLMNPLIRRRLCKSNKSFGNKPREHFLRNDFGYYFTCLLSRSSHFGIFNKLSHISTSGKRVISCSQGNITDEQTPVITQIKRRGEKREKGANVKGVSQMTRKNLSNRVDILFDRIISLRLYHE